MSDPDPASTPPAAPDPGWGPPAEADPARWWTLFAVCIATFMLLLDITVVNVALPDIAKDLHSSFSDLQWVVDAYALGLASLLLLWGAAADQFGRKTIFVIGLVGFTVASLLCALSTTPLELNLARALQGFGGAAMFATSLALLASTFHGKERGTAIGIWGATTGAGVAVGPLVGGILLQIANWHWVFLVNIPIGIGALAITLRTVQNSRNPNARGLDVPGAITFSFALFLLVFGLVRGNSEGWGSAIIVGSLVGSVVLLIAFLVIQSRSTHALFDLSLLRNRSFVGVSIAAFALSATMFSLFLYLTLWIQNGLGYTPLQAGIRFLPVTLLSFIVAPIAGRASARVSPAILICAGLSFVGVGILLMLNVGGHSGWTAALPGFMLAGIGIGMTNPPLASTAVSVVEGNRAGMAAGSNNTFRQVGIATGTAAFGAIITAVVSHSVHNSVTHQAGAAVAAKLPSSEALASGSSKVIAFIPNSHQLYMDAYTHGLDVLFAIAGIGALIGAGLAATLIRRSDILVSGPAPTALHPAAGASVGKPSPAA